MYKMWTL